MGIMNWLMGSSTASIASHELANYLKENPAAKLLDVRGQAEANSDGDIPNSLRIDLNGGQFKEKAEKLDKSLTYVVYCRSGGRSSMACRILNDLGFENIVNLSGGITAYNAIH